MKRILGAVGRSLVLLPSCSFALRVAAPELAAADTTAAIVLDTASAAARLAGAVRYPTVSLASGAPIDTAAFLGLHEHLRTSFPLVHASLTREVVGGLSLLYTWPGTDPQRPPLVLMGHMDVVPVTEANRTEWSHGPFDGHVADGFVWGRGTLDDKTTVLSILEAVETLLKSGHKPTRTIYLTFGHDEEVGGVYGARTIVSKLVSEGVKPALVLDEGGFMAAGMMTGLEQRSAIVGIAEKGYVSLELKAHAAGGHSSMPTERTAIGALSQAITRLDANPFPRRLDGPTRRMIEAMAPYLPFPRRMMIANLWLTAPLVSRTLAANPLGSALMHTTIAPTMLSAGIKDNVLPPEATAVVNFRIQPGETVASVMERVTEVVSDSQITVSPVDGGVDPSPVSDVNSQAWQLLARTIHSMVPGEQPPVIPYLVMGGTDAKYWGAHSDRVFRFLPVPLGEGDRERVHGVNERISMADYAASVGFFARLIRGMDTMPDSP
jgi:carboxypeptidase PM20D1